MSPGCFVPACCPSADLSPLDEGLASRSRLEKQALAHCSLSTGANQKRGRYLLLRFFWRGIVWRGVVGSSPGASTRWTLGVLNLYFCSWMAPLLSLKRSEKIGRVPS